MRDIIFRGKRVDNGEWIEGYYVCLNEKAHFIYSGYAAADCGTYSYCPEYYKVIPETVGQYTGLTDKKSTRIFEGDIIENYAFNTEDGGYAVVEYDDGAFELNGNGICATFHENYRSGSCEVIGNIHDNPELI